MNISRTELTDYVSRARQAIQGKTGSELVQDAAARRLDDIATFTQKLEQTPGENVEQILAASRDRSGTGLQRGLLNAGIVAGIALTIGGIFAGAAGIVEPVVAVLGTAGGVATGAGSIYKLDQYYAEDRFQGSVAAFAEDAHKQVEPGLLSGWRPGPARSSTDDDGWLINPGNPASPLSPLNPANPASPLNPFF